MKEKGRILSLGPAHFSMAESEELTGIPVRIIIRISGFRKGY